MTSSFLLLQWTIPTAKEQIIVDVTRIASFTHESTQIQDNNKIFAAAESYKKNKYQEASAHKNAVTYPFVMTRFGGLGNDAKKNSVQDEGRCSRKGQVSSWQ